MYVTVDGLSWFGTIDGFVNGTWGIAFIGLIECVARRAGSAVWINYGSTPMNAATGISAAGGTLLIRVVIPIVLGTLFFWSLYDNLEQLKAGTFLKDTEGKWILGDCVGMGVMILACLLAITMSLVKGPRRKKPKPMIRPENAELNGFGRVPGVFAFVLTCIALLGLVVIYTVVLSDSQEEALLFGSMILAVIALLTCHILMERYDKGALRPSGFARWAGILSIIDVSACLVIILISLSGRVDVDKVPVEHGDHLSGVSYIILGVAFILIVFGLGVCFWKALQTASQNEPDQPQEEMSA